MQTSGIYKGGGFFVEVYERVVVNLSFRYLKGPLIKKFEQMDLE